jgi:hypothetical protein
VARRSRSEVESCSTIRSTNVWAIATLRNLSLPADGCTPSETKVQFLLGAPVGDPLQRAAKERTFGRTGNPSKPLKDLILGTIGMSCRTLSTEPPLPPMPR